MYFIYWLSTLLLSQKKTFNNKEESEFELWHCRIKRKISFSISIVWVSFFSTIRWPHQELELKSENNFWSFSYQNTVWFYPKTTLKLCFLFWILCCSIVFKCDAVMPSDRCWSLSNGEQEAFRLKVLLLQLLSVWCWTGITIAGSRQLWHFSATGWKDSAPFCVFVFWPFVPCRHTPIHAFYHQANVKEHVAQQFNPFCFPSE